MIVAIIILTVIAVAALLMATFYCALYHRTCKDFEAYQRITEERLKLDNDRYSYLCDLADEILILKKHRL